MKIISATKNALVLEPSRKEKNYKAFIFDVGIIPDSPKPKVVKVVKKIGPYTHTWSITWRKFLNVGCVGDIVILEMDKMIHSFKKDK